MISDNGRKLIEEFEGCILCAYDDYNDKIVGPGKHPRGTLTIGYGHTTAAGSPKVYVGMVITKEQADKILSTDLHAVELQVDHLVTVATTQNQKDALGSFEFNTGALHSSTLLKLLNEGKYTEAADEFLKWNHADGVVLEGLTKRREAERALFLKHDDQPIVDIAPDAPKSLFGMAWQALCGYIFSKERQMH